MSGYWETKEGKIIPFEDLEDQHLLNIIKRLKKKSIIGTFIPDDREDPSAGEYVTGKDYLYYTKYDKLKEIARKRGLIHGY